MKNLRNVIILTVLSLTIAGCGGDLTPTLQTIQTQTQTMALATPSFYALGGTGSSDASITIGDVTHDGKADVIVGMSNSIEVFVGKGTGSLYTEPLMYNTGNGVSSVTVASLRNNGFNDVVVTNATDSTIGVLLGNSTGLGSQTTVASGTTPVAALVADINGDGYPDIMSLNENSNSVSVFINNNASPGSFAAAVGYAGLSTPVAFCMADFNRDGVKDLAVLNQGNNTISILLGNSNGTFNGAIAYGPYVGTLWSIGCGDFNGDGRPDVVFTSTNGSIGGSLNLVLGNGDGTLAAFSPTNAYPAGHITTALGAGLVVGDFLGTGILDVMTSASADANLNIFLGSGAGTFSTPQNYPTSSGMVAIAGGSLRGNGKFDWVSVPATASNFVLLSSE